MGPFHCSSVESYTSSLSIRCIWSNKSLSRHFRKARGGGHPFGLVPMPTPRKLGENGRNLCPVKETKTWRNNSFQSHLNTKTWKTTTGVLQNSFIFKKIMTFLSIMNFSTSLLNIQGKHFAFFWKPETLLAGKKLGYLDQSCGSLHFQNSTKLRTQRWGQQTPMGH